MAKKPAPKKKAAKRKNRPALTRQEEAFCQHYALNQVGSDAIRHAFPSWKTRANQDVAVKASKLLAQSKIKVRISALATRALETMEKKFEVTVERLTAEMAAMGFVQATQLQEWGTIEVPLYHKNGDPMLDKNGNHIVEYKPWVKFKDSKDLTEEQIKAVAGVSLTYSKTGDPVMEVKTADKLAALKALGTHLGMFKSIVQAEGKGGGPINIVVSNAEANL